MERTKSHASGKGQRTTSLTVQARERKTTSQTIEYETVPSEEEELHRLVEQIKTHNRRTRHVPYPIDIRIRKQNNAFLLIRQTFGLPWSQRHRDRWEKSKR